MAITVRVKGLEAITKKLQQQNAQAERAIRETANDMRNRVPGWVATEVTSTYGIKKSEVMPAKRDETGRLKLKKRAGNVYVSGTTIADVAVVYKGRTLTASHFSPNPTRPRRARKRKRKHRANPKAKRPAPITAEIIKGQRDVLHSGSFMGANKGGGYIPFRRSGPSRYPIESIQTLSLPQMVGNEEVYKRIQKKVDEGLAKRFLHNVNRFMK